MTNYDDLLREKDNDDVFNVSAMEDHWTAMEKKIGTHSYRSPSKYRKMFRAIIAVAAASVVVFFCYTLFKEKKQQPRKIDVAIAPRSAVIPPLNGTNVPYEIFTFNAATGDTLFTLNGSIIIFPRNAVLNSKGELVTGNIEVRTREFNDPFDYSIAGIPMDYDSTGTRYKFVSSGMIDISAYQNGEALLVNPDAKPQLHLVSTNKERKTNLYKLDTVNGNWINRGKDEVNLVNQKNSDAVGPREEAVYRDIANRSLRDSITTGYLQMPEPPQKASDLHPVIAVNIDPASFKELLVYDGLKFEVTDAKTGTVAEDSKVEWNKFELIRGEKAGTYKVIFSAKDRKATYNVKPVLEGKDFEAAEKLYEEKLKEYTRLQNKRKKRDDEQQNLLTKQIEEDQRAEKTAKETNKAIEEMNKLIALRNKFIEAENIKIEALNKENRRRSDSAIKANSAQMEIWAQNNRMATLEENLIRSFEIDGFGYWNCDQPTLPQTQQYVGTFKTLKNEVVSYGTLCIAAAGINRLQNYYGTNAIGLIPNSSYFGWAFNATSFYYFTREDFKNALTTNNPNTISISMTLYQGDVKNYNELKAYIYNVNTSNDLSKN